MVGRPAPAAGPRLGRATDDVSTAACPRTHAANAGVNLRESAVRNIGTRVQDVARGDRDSRG